MSKLQSAFTQSNWSLVPGEALSLEIGPGARELSVVEGRVWLTQAGSLQDIWLEPGQSVSLASGSQIVLEAWPSAQFQLLVPPSVCPSLARRARPTAATSNAAWLKPAGLATA